MDSKHDWNDTQTETLIFGKNPVKELLKSGRAVEKLLVAVEDERTIADIIKLASQKKLLIQHVDKRRLDKLSENGIHQGIAAIASPYAYLTLDALLSETAKKSTAPLLLILDQITDPHNYGAILRVAECSGVDGIVIGKHRSASMTSAAVKASAGASEYVRIAKTTNLSDTIRHLKQEGYWIAGADMSGTPMTQCSLTGPLAVVIGSEGSGISQNVKKHCDFFIRIPMKGRIDSLNASVAAGVILYEAMRQRGPAEC